MIDRKILLTNLDFLKLSGNSEWIRSPYNSPVVVHPCVDLTNLNRVVFHGRGTQTSSHEAFFNFVHKNLLWFGKWRSCSLTREQLGKEKSHYQNSD